MDIASSGCSVSSGCTSWPASRRQTRLDRLQRGPQCASRAARTRRSAARPAWHCRSYRDAVQVGRARGRVAAQFSARRTRAALPVPHREAGAPCGAERCPALCPQMHRLVRSGAAPCARGGGLERAFPSDSPPHQRPPPSARRTEPETGGEARKTSTAVGRTRPPSDQPPTNTILLWRTYYSIGAL
eukprot:scaffold182301_cov33-Tisochrysis_lutea.AAC.2